MAESERPTRQSEEWQETEEKIVGRSHLGSEVPFDWPKIHLHPMRIGYKWFMVLGRPTCLLFALSYWLQYLIPLILQMVKF